MSQDETGERVFPPHVSEQDVLSLNSESESLDAVFRALADYRRRCVCHYLSQADGPIPVADLAELVAASMTEKTRAVLTSAEIEKTRAELVRMHIPKLEEVDVVDHDREEGTVALAESPGVDACLRASSDVDLE